MQVKSVHQVAYLDLINMNNEFTGGGFPEQSDLSEGNLCNQGTMWETSSTQNKFFKLNCIC